MRAVTERLPVVGSSHTGNWFWLPQLPGQLAQFNQVSKPTNPPTVGSLESKKMARRWMFDGLGHAVMSAASACGFHSWPWIFKLRKCLICFFFVLFFKFIYRSTQISSGTLLVCWCVTQLSPLENKKMLSWYKGQSVPRNYPPHQYTIISLNSWYNGERSSDLPFLWACANWSLSFLFFDQRCQT